MADEHIFHITEPSLWDQATVNGSYEWSTRGRSLAEIGFIHCSFAHQIAKVAGFVYADFVGELVLLEIDPALAGAEIRVESLGGGDERFPHIYGLLPIGAVVHVRPYTARGSTSSHQSDALGPGSK